MSMPGMDSIRTVFVDMNSLSHLEYRSSFYRRVMGIGRRGSIARTGQVPTERARSLAT